MILYMRTTLDINDKLLMAAKLHAEVTRRTLSAVIEDALRATLEVTPATSPQRVHLPSCSMGKTLPGVDIHRNAATLDIMECTE